MHVNKDDVERIKKEAIRAKASREFDIRQLSDLLVNFVRLFDGEETSDIAWALENISDESSAVIAENVAMAESIVGGMYAKYLFKGGIDV